jgi:serine/threonine protein kinase
VAQVHRSGGFEGPGELLTAAYLERELPESWLIVCNKEIPGGASSREVDFIVIGEHAVFVVEEKHWSGRIVGDESGWVLSDGESRPSPLNQVKQASAKLNGFLRREIPGLAGVLGHVRLNTDVVLMSARSQIAVNDPRVHKQVWQLEGCDSDFLRIDEERSRGGSIASVREPIVRRLTTLPDQPTIPTAVRDYEVLEVLDASGPVTSLLAKHQDGSRRILKIVPRPTTLDPGRLEEQENALLREYAALRTLAQTGVTPSVQDYFTWDRDRTWVYPIDLPDGRSLLADMLDDLPRAEVVAGITAAAFEALAIVHNAGVTHRGITPARIWLRTNGGVMLTDFQVARIAGAETVAGAAEELDPDNAYRAPECRADPSLASTASDVYSLAASLFSWITGTAPDEWDGAIPALASLRFDLPPDLLQVLTTVFVDSCGLDVSRRPRAADTASALRGLNVVAPEDPRKEEEPQPGETLLGRYRVVRFLGAGATASTYLVEDTFAGYEFVLKRIQDRRLAARLGLAEFRHLVELNHPNLVRVFDVFPPEERVHLRMEYVPGSRLADVSERFLGKTDRVIHMAEQIFRALSYLDARHRIHRDISPKNLMVPDEEDAPVKLIDFGLATLEEGAMSAVGTPLYRAPEIDRGEGWTSKCDLYSVGVVLFETLTGRLPYTLDGQVPIKSMLVEPSEQERETCGGEVLEVLLRATAPDPAERFDNAEEFEEALRSATITSAAPRVDGIDRRNPTVDEIRGLFRNSTFGNAGNRGLDTEFARQTYVETSLDTMLAPALVAGGLRFVVLSGNPGDGKTAFLERLRGSLSEQAFRDVSPADEAGWRMSDGRQEIAAVYDASESHGDLSADELLDRALAPLGGEGEPESPFTAVIAANDGRLLDFFERRGDRDYPWLWSRIRRLFDDPSEPIDGVILVDMKRRSVVGSSPPLFEKILVGLTSPSRWEVCEDCSAREVCPMRFNALSFSDEVLGPVVRSRLGKLLGAVHLRRERRPTVRELRSALSYLITQDLSCEQIHEERRAGVPPLSAEGRPYYNAAFDGAGGPDLLLDQWRQLDPANVASPRMDRFLFFHRRRPSDPDMKAAFTSASVRPSSTDAGASEDDWLRGIKRRYLFEGVAEGGDVELPEPERLLPYQYLAEFERVLSGREDPDAALRRLLQGISRADSVPAGAIGDGLALRTSESVEDDDEVIVIKVFSRSEFSLAVNDRAGGYVESTPDQLILAHGSNGPSLAIGLDLFEFLSRSAEGMLPGSLEQRPLLEDLAGFKHHLLARTTERVSLSEAGRRVHTVVASRGFLSLVEES